ncbi:hypothetical protein OQA88_5956 [Cercophora sp. LCS_1]
MSDIYSAASQVVAWLGSQDPPLQFMAMHQNEQLEEYMTRVALGETNPTPTPAELEAMGLQTLHDWREMWWIIQETALAREIIVLCGSQTLDWTRLIVIGKLLISSGLSSQLTLLGARREKVEAVVGCTPGSEIKQLHMFRTDHRLNGDLLMYLHKTRANFMRGRQDGEEVDVAAEELLKAISAVGDGYHKEFAYFAIVSRRFSEYRATDKRDHMTVEEVLTEVAATFLTNLPALSLLSLADIQHKRYPSLLSWVPDFTYATDIRLLILRMGEPRNSDRTDGLGQPIYNATKVPWPPDGVSPSPLARSDGRLLHVSGARVDRIEIIYYAHFTGLEFRYIPYLEFALYHLPSLYQPTGEPREEALWRTMCGNYNASEGVYPAPFHVGAEWFRQHVLEITSISMVRNLGADEAFADALHTFTVLMRLNVEGAGSTFSPNEVELTAQFHAYVAELNAVVQSLTRDAGGVEPSEEAVQVAMAAILGVSRAEKEWMDMLMTDMAIPHRRLYVTVAGFLGVAPANVRRGDEVWLIRRARVPFILRHREGRSVDEFTLVGETYLHGGMNGELVDPEVGVGVTSISLC